MHVWIIEHRGVYDEKWHPIGGGFYNTKEEAECRRKMRPWSHEFRIQKYIREERTHRKMPD